MSASSRVERVGGLVARTSEAFGPDARTIGLLAIVTAFVGAMLGLERTVLPLVAGTEFGITSAVGVLAFVATFGLSKAAMNLTAGHLADRVGRRRVLMAGWIAALPVPLLILLAPSWTWIVAANVLLGVSQGMAWSMTVVMKLDLVGERRRGLVVGLNEFAGYGGMAAAAYITGVMAASAGLRAAPFVLGLVLATGGLVLSLYVPETDRSSHQATGQRDGNERLRTVFRRVTWAKPALSGASLAGLATNLKDGVLWGLLPLVLARDGLSLGQIGATVALYPAVWSVTQLVTGSLSDGLGRRGLIGAGLMLQAAGVALLAGPSSFTSALTAAVLVGLGTGMAYPTLQAFVADAAGSSWRASALGVYRMWRDMGYVVGALGFGLLADAVGLPAALAAMAGLLAAVAAIFVVRTADATQSKRKEGVTMSTRAHLPTVAAARAVDVNVDALRAAIRTEYEVVALRPEQGFHFHTGRPLAQRLGYDEAWLAGVPESSVASFAGTGNPFAAGPIPSGARIVDVGCGAGMDSLIAARLVGPAGEVIGVDMTTAMLGKARAAAGEAGLANVAFREGLAESLPVPGGWADVLISNGVLNLMPDKLAALAEMARVLKPGGRLQMGDIAVDRPVPEDAKRDIDLWTG